MTTNSTSLANRIRAILIAACTSSLAILCGAAQAKGEIPEEYRAAVETAEFLGTAIYVHDSAAARATDELFERGVIQKDPRIRGWITAMTGDSKAVVVTFVGLEDGTPHALYRVSVFAGDAPLHYEALEPAQELTRTENASYSARTLALTELENDSQACAEQYNTVVLPTQRAGDRFILVYLLAATDKPGVVVAGGHLRYEVSPDGQRIEGKRAFTKSCMVIPPDNARKESDVAAMMLTHLLDPTPTEIHVFMSRLYKKPFFIGTSGNDLVWKVDGGSIELVDTKKQ